MRLQQWFLNCLMPPRTRQASRPRPRMSSDGVDRSSVDPRARDWKPTRRGVKMSGGVSPISTTSGTPSLGVPFQVGSPVTTSFSSLTDTTGNPIELDTSSQELGIFAEDPLVAKASKSVLSYLSPTPAHAANRPVAKATHKAK
jgi:hypothetical protein